MLSSSSSALLLSTLQNPLKAAGGHAASLPGGKALPGFAALLNGLATEGLPAGAEALPGAVDLGGAAAEALPGAVDLGGAAAEAAAKAEAAATANGKILPVALPVAAEADGEPGTRSASAERQTGEASDETVEPLPVADPLLAPLPAANAPAPQAPVATPQAPVAAPGRLPVAVGPVARATGKPQPANDQPNEARSTPSVQITVAARPETSPARPADPVAASEAAAAAPAKPVRSAEIRAEALLPPAPPAPATVAQAEPASPVQAATVASAAAPAPSAADINAALDRLVAAREALMPAEAALAIEHADFGEVSIRFEQSADGRLSAELRSVDPELQRAVNAAAGAERGLSSGTDADSSGRSANLANARGSAAGGDAAAGERGQPGNERDLNRRRAPDRPEAEPGNTDPRPGVFA